MTGQWEGHSGRSWAEAIPISTYLEGPSPIQCAFFGPTPTILTGDVFTWMGGSHWPAGKSLLHLNVSQAYLSSLAEGCR